MRTGRGFYNKYSYHKKKEVLVRTHSVRTSEDTVEESFTKFGTNTDANLDSGVLEQIL